jgi:hypothetical protein
VRPDAALADRYEAVRAAAADWHRTGWIDDDTRSRIHILYPDDRVRAGRVFRILFFILAVCALQGGLGLIYMMGRSGIDFGAIAMFGAVACAAGTEYLLGPMKRRQSGIESAFSAVALVQVFIAAASLVNSLQSGFERRLAVDLFLFGVLSIAGAWRWGYTFYAAAGAVMIFVSVTGQQWGRLFWIALPMLLFAPLLASCDETRIPPVLRRCGAAALAVTILAFYAAINTYSLDQRMLESGLWTGRSSVTLVPRALSIALTAMTPPALLVLGIGTRRRLLMNLGLALSVVSAVTVREYSHILPLWLALSGGGVVLLGGAALTARYLGSGAGKERHGLTAEPLFDNPRNRRALEMLAGIASFTPGARTMPAEKAGFEGGGGKFGGGGASGSF